ncbi:MAG: tetratricopeptide repeat protein [bacterium]
MTNRIAIMLTAAILATTSIASCSSTGKPDSLYAKASVAGQQTLLESSRKAAESAIRASERSEKKDLAMGGIDSSERCLMAAPENPGCYYWRAVNTGLYHSVHVSDYQKGVKRMVSDCEKVIGIDPDYENAGAYRMLGQLYTRLPQTAIHPGSVIRDLDRAEDYLRKAVQISPDYPENHLALAETLLENGKAKEAMEELILSNELAPQWRKDISYEQWRHESLALERKIEDKSGD